jgi:hypothetical protein
MSKHHNSKTEPAVANGGVPATSAADTPVQDQTPSAKSNGGDVEIARLAYSYWEARGCPMGSAEQDWLRAEQEMKALRL